MTTLRYWDPTTSSWVAMAGPQGIQGAQGAQGIQGAQGAQGIQGPGFSGATAGGDLTGTYPNPTVARLQGVPVNSTAPGAATIPFYNPTGDSAPANQWIPVTLAGDIIQANWPSAVNAPVSYQVRGLYGQPMSAPGGTGTTIRFNGTQWVPCATGGNISNNATYMNNPAGNWAAPSGFSVIGGMSPANLPMNAMQTYLLIATVTITGTAGTLVEIGFSQSTTGWVFSGGWTTNAYFQIPVQGYPVSVTCWGFLGNYSATSVYLCIQTNAAGVTVIRNQYNYCTGQLAVALGYGNS